MKTSHRLLLATLALILAALYVRGAAAHLRLKNTNIASHNQSAYVRYARRLAESGWTYHGDGNRMPLYPALQALLYRDDMPDETLFERGKWANIALSLLLLAGLAAWLWRRFPGWCAIVLTLITAFTIFAVKAAYFQPELLFYALNLACFVMLWDLLRRPRWPRALAAGALLALAYLTKASVTPMLALWVAVMVGQAAARGYRSRRASPGAPPSTTTGAPPSTATGAPPSATTGAPPSLAASPSSAALMGQAAARGRSAKQPGAHRPEPNSCHPERSEGSLSSSNQGLRAPEILRCAQDDKRGRFPGAPPSTATGAPPSLAASLLSAALVVVAFLATLAPYLVANQRIYGRPFYNVNSTFYMWYDTWEQAKAGTAAHGDREGWPQMPADQIPSPQKYLREHTPAQMAARVWRGLVILEEYARRSLGYYKYVWIYLALAAMGAALERRRLAQLIGAHAGQAAYAALYFPAHAVLYAWYEPIGHGDRFILAQFLPWVFVLSAALWATARRRRVTLWGRSISLVDAAHLALLPLVAYDVYLTLAVRILTQSGGN